MSLLNMSARRWTVTSCTPENPYESDWILRRSMSFTISGRTVSPVPQACDMTRLCWSWDRSFAGMVMLHNDPNPVVTPYTGRPMSSILVSRYLRHLMIAASASSPSFSFIPSLMMVLTISNVSFFGEIMWSMFCVCLKIIQR